jgi:hypothetical protein
MNDKRNMNIKMAGSVNAHSKMNDKRNMNIKMAGSVNAHSKMNDNRNMNIKMAAKTWITIGICHYLFGFNDLR